MHCSGERTVRESGSSRSAKSGTAERQKDRFAVETDRGIYTGDFLILACGSMAAKGTGSDGSGYELARAVWTPDHQAAPGACPAPKCEGNLLPKASGVRTDCLVEIRTGDGKTAAKDRGELQITDYGISGIPVFQVSRYAAKLLDRKQKVSAVLELSAGSG